MSTPPTARTQTRFQEDHEPDSKPKRNLKKNAQPAPIGNTSSSPGPWLIETVANFWMSQSQPRTKEQTAEYESAVEVMNSYLPRPRYRTLKYPMGPHLEPDDIRPEALAKIFISDEYETLETRSFCFGEADVADLKQEDTSPNFPYMNQPGVWSGPELQKYLATAKSLVSLSRSIEREQVIEQDEPLYSFGEDADDEDLSDILTVTETDEEDGSDEPVAAPEPIKTKLHTMRVSNEKFNADYAAWFAEPISENQTTFFETLSRFISGKVRMVSKDDTISKRGAAQDLGQDFVIEMMEQLVEQQAAGKVLKNPADYIAWSWTYTTWDENTRIAEHDFRFPGTVKPGVVDSDGESSEVDLIDRAAALAWFRGSNSTGEVQGETEDESLERRKAMLGTIEDESLRDVVGLWMAMKTERQIADELGISPQKVGRLKVKIKAALATAKGMAAAK